MTALERWLLWATITGFWTKTALDLGAALLTLWKLRKQLKALEVKFKQ